MGENSYRDRSGNDPLRGSAITVGTARSDAGPYVVQLELGVMRNFGSLSTDAWAVLSPAEARELAADLRHAADRAEQREARA